MHSHHDHTTQGVTWIQRPGVTWTQAIAALALAVALAATAVASGSDSSVVGDSSVSFLGKPSRQSLTDGTDGLTMDAVRELEAVGMQTDGYTGQGIDIALIDTGVAPVQGLNAPGKVLHGPDLSNEGGTNQATVDTFGHGTHIAGIIAGNDGTDNGFKGMAPDSRIISVKVAGSTGETSVAQVIAAIDWVIDHRNSDGLNIRVLNLSLGQTGVTSNENDPLSAAVERAWDAGIVVVVAAGNGTNDANGLDSPAVSPYVIATGALNGLTAGEKVAKFSSSGDGNRNPDLVAPGRSIISLSAPGSTLATANPHAAVGSRYIRGSGTSQAAAVMSGSVALLLSADPSLTPDQVKHALTWVADEVDRKGTRLDGEGKVRPDTSALISASTEVRNAEQNHKRAFGFGDTSDQSTWSGGTWSGGTWSGGTWSGATWSGSTWSGGTWSGGTWSGGTWSGGTWSGGTWSAGTWG